MPWPAKQRTAIFLDIKRRKGEKAAREFMHRHGYGGGRHLMSAHKKRTR
jgi:hypothetical protein